jgi:uncharacterized protein (TIGR02266 family)
MSGKMEARDERRSAERPARRPVLELVPDADEVDSAREPECAVDLAVDIGFLGQTSFYTGFSDDVARGGLFVATHQLRPVGTAITLSFVLPDGVRVVVAGRVAWIREVPGGDLWPGMGISFDGPLDDASAAAIRRFAEHRPPIFHE